ncbi:hypothetical protein GCM10012275_08040 [Longimycelium tulufanense]|uniref:Fibronectin type-III domain-containing protein n=1 Tax=Longimycelium tulufanense TaxID=907463 RepID=A0A8J3CCJ2_9PSEU|nr:hypothetical protein [Longimycelium tulufanense]GGM39552.1 hypothetical protein GCM10012275_08040 [Longimycelium tulufanense]
MNRESVRIGRVGEVYFSTDDLSPLEVAQATDASLPIPARFSSVGLLSDDGFEHEFSEDVKEITNWTRGNVSQIIRGRVLTMKFTALETSGTTVGMFYGSDAQGNELNVVLTVTNGYSRRPCYALLYCIYDGPVQWRLFVPHAHVTELDAPEFTPGGMVKWGITFKAMDNAGYLATWSTNDPTVTQGHGVAPPRIFLPELVGRTGRVRPWDTVGGLGMLGATVTVETSDGQRGTFPVGPDGYWWADLHDFPPDQEITVTATQTYQGWESDRAVHTIRTFPRPKTPLVSSVVTTKHDLTVHWHTEPTSATRWVFRVWDPATPDAVHDVGETSTPVAESRLSLDPFPELWGRDLLLRIDAEGDGGTTSSNGLPFRVARLTSPTLVHASCMARTLTTEWQPASGTTVNQYEVRISALPDPIALVPGDTTQWTGEIPATCTPHTTYTVSVLAQMSDGTELSSSPLAFTAGYGGALLQDISSADLTDTTVTIRWQLTELTPPTVTSWTVLYGPATSSQLTTVTTNLPPDSHETSFTLQHPSYGWQAKPGDRMAVQVVATTTPSDPTYRSNTQTFLLPA